MIMMTEKQEHLIIRLTQIFGLLLIVLLFLFAIGAFGQSINPADYAITNLQNVSSKLVVVSQKTNQTVPIAADNAGEHLLIYWGVTTNTLTFTGSSNLLKLPFFDTNFVRVFWQIADLESIGVWSPLSTVSSFSGYAPTLTLTNPTSYTVQIRQDLSKPWQAASWQSSVTLVNPTDSAFFRLMQAAQSQAHGALMQRQAIGPPPTLAQNVIITPGRKALP